MANVIWKFRISQQIIQEGCFLAPVGSKIRHMGLDPNGKVCAWVECDPKADQAPIPVAVIPTGGEFPAGDWRYLGCVVDGSFVWHVLVGASA